MEELISRSKKAYYELLRDGWIPGEDYVFISYSSRDWEKAYPCVLALRALGINVYIDIEFQENQSSSWLKNLQVRLFEEYGCMGIVSFLSIDYMRSYACLAEQLANRTARMHTLMGKPLPVFYVALDPDLSTLSGMHSCIYQNSVRRESMRHQVEMSPQEFLFLQESILDCNLERYRDEKSVQKLLNNIHNKHNVVTTMYELIFSDKKEMPNFLLYEGAESCAKLLRDNFVNDKNDSIQLRVLEDLQEETRRRLTEFLPEEEQGPVTGGKAEESGMTESLPGEKAKGADTTSPGPSEALQTAGAELDNPSVPEPVVDALLAAAEQGDASAQYRLGMLYKDGEGVEQSYEKAAEWYCRAAEQGHPEAQRWLGWLYKKGRGTGRSFAKAAEWYGKAAEQGDAIAQYNLGMLYMNGKGVKGSYEQAAEWFRKAAEQGDAGAQCYLGWLYKTGLGVAQSFAKAAEWYQSAAEQGYARACYQLGWAYRNGEGVEKSHERAAELFCQAAEQGYARAFCSVAWCYEKGEGVPRDSMQAFYWYQKAADHGDCKAQYNLAWMYRKGTGTKRSDEEAARWFRSAAEQGCGLAQFWTGKAYAYGDGVAQSWEEAVKWYRLAAGQNESRAKKELAVCCEKGLGVPKDPEKAAYWRKESEK